MFYGLICINNHVFSCLIIMLSGGGFFFSPSPPLLSLFLSSVMEKNYVVPNIFVWDISSAHGAPLSPPPSSLPLFLYCKTAKISFKEHIQDFRFPFKKNLKILPPFFYIFAELVKNIFMIKLDDPYMSKLLGSEAR